MRECGKGEKRGRRNKAARVSPAEAALDSTCTDTRQRAPYWNKQMMLHSMAAKSPFGAFGQSMRDFGASGGRRSGQRDQRRAWNTGTLQAV